MDGVAAWMGLQWGWGYVVGEAAVRSTVGLGGAVGARVRLVLSSA